MHHTLTCSAAGKKIPLAEVTISYKSLTVFCELTITGTVDGAKGQNLKKL